MPDSLVWKLRRVTALSPGEVKDIHRLCSDVRTAAAEQVLVREGQAVNAALLIHHGWAFRYRLFSDGRRQIVDFLIPGDFCEPNAFTVRNSDFSVQTITEVTYSVTPLRDLLRQLHDSPRIGIAFWWLTAHEEAVLRAHLVAVGRMTAYERIAYLLWEMWKRLDMVRMTASPVFEFPATQEMIADAMGMCLVHANRTLRRLEREDVIRRAGRTIRILDARRLADIAHAAGILHLEHMPLATERWLREAGRRA